MKTVIQSLWIGRPLSLIEQLSITSFLRNGHEYHLYCYGEVKNVPAGTTLRDGAEILPASEIFCYQQGPGKGSVAAFSNLFRYKLLLEKGGWWVDTDVVCLRPFDFTAPIIFASERQPANPTPVPPKTASAVIRLPPGHAVASSCYDAARRENREQLTWGKIGPPLLNRVVHESNLQTFMVAPEVFSPLDFWNWKMLLEKSRPSAPLFDDKSYAIHLWHELWRRTGLLLDPATGVFQTVHPVKKYWRRIRGKPSLTLDPHSNFVELLHRYLPKHDSNFAG